MLVMKNQKNNDSKDAWRGGGERGWGGEGGDINVLCSVEIGGEGVLGRPQPITTQCRILTH